MNISTFLSIKVYSISKSLERFVFFLYNAFLEGNHEKQNHYDDNKHYVIDILQSASLEITG